MLQIYKKRKFQKKTNMISLWSNADNQIKSLDHEIDFILLQIPKKRTKKRRRKNKKISNYYQCLTSSIQIKTKKVLP